ncbi:putative aldouronate transport system permease protein [Paenibacillus endophyticus]|uniref:Putative aldouronate transport system permease protein n=1 Tax=Paenibacillus endophyticus TaxID=1294268 RepID=A0A7W5GDG9_9BACL|nr:carbohydrate ABC transporter permease [Paenibacillus endophyticus]MBB3155905.1 putative aldouronate transport system permease protein [Paenibacillus endophyticus]
MKKIATSSTILDKLISFINFTILVLLSLSILLPILNVLALAFNEGSNAAKGGIYFWPRAFTFGNFTEVFKQSNIINGFFVSMFRTVVGTVLSVVLTAMAAYALKSRSLPGHKQITFIIFFTMLFSGGMIPYYLVLKNLSLTNSIWVYVLPALYSVWNMMIMRSFFEQIPAGLEEAAKIDGCGDFAIFMRMVVPVSKPVFAAIALFNAVGHWNDWFTGAFYVRDESLKPLSTVLQEMLTKQKALADTLTSVTNAIQLEMAAKITVTGTSLKMATIIIVITPIIIVYPLLQKYFAQGVMIGSIKE